jgi:DNA-binding NarL/FixJ family response regulator
VSAAEDLAVDFSPRPELEHVLRRCTELLGCDAGSICSVDEAAGTYRKEADIGVACQSGQVFPLTADAAVAACRELRPDVVLADLGLTAGDTAAAGNGAGAPNALGVIELLLGELPGQAVVGLCEAGDERLVAEAMRVGARGCVDTWADGPELARAIIAAGRGQAILSAPALAQLQRGLREDAVRPALTERERQVRGLMEQGLPDKIIAERLVLSVKTVEKHAGAVLRKTGARNRAELAALASQARPRHIR